LTLGVDFGFGRIRKDIKSKSKNKSNVKDGGQECRPYTKMNIFCVPASPTVSLRLLWNLDMAESSVLARKYEYRRRMPHYQKPDRAIFVTFSKHIRDAFPEAARDLILVHCRHDHGKRIDLHGAVVMPDHVHLLLTPLPDEHGWPYPLPAILKLIKGVSARNVNKLLGTSGPVWQEESLEHTVRNDGNFQEKLEYIRQNPVRRGLVTNPEDYPWLWIAPK
jgi:putative transposase